MRSRARRTAGRKLPGISISISSEVSPQMREFERFNTVCANAYVRPQMAAISPASIGRLTEVGTHCPVFMIHSGGGMIAVESGFEVPGAPGRIRPGRRRDLRRRHRPPLRPGEGRLLRHGRHDREDLPDRGLATPHDHATFEVARTYRFCKGSGMPISIPVIEMIEIGAGGGSIAWVDAMGRIQTGPESAGSEPGPACYGRGGKRPTITDADLVLGKLDPDNFAGGAIRLDTAASRTGDPARCRRARCRSTPMSTAFGICEVVDENMANAARVHAVENGKNISDNLMIAFGGAAPLHAARLCEKLGIERCIVPPGAGVGSAIGFLKAPFGYEALASQPDAACRGSSRPRSTRCSATSRRRPRASCAAGASGSIACEITAFMRYAGQGWEIPVAAAGRAVRRRMPSQN